MQYLVYSSAIRWWNIETFLNTMITQLKVIRNFAPFHPSIRRCATTHEKESKIKLIQLEIQLLREMGEYYVPDKIQSKFWPDLLNLPTKNHRTKFYKHLKLLEVAETARRTLKAETEIQYAEREKKQRENEHISYGLRRNSLFMYIRNGAMNRFYNYNLTNSILFGQKLVLDFGYDENMNESERKKCARQTQILYGVNKVNRDPFDLYFCNLQPDSRFDRQLRAAIGTLKTKECLVTTTSRSYLEIFPKRKLVYLSPDCRDDLRRFNHDDVYIIGGLVDRGHADRLSLAKVKREGLRVARLPLTNYFPSNMYDKSLHLDVVFKILLTLKNTNSWVKAFQHIPKSLFHDEDNSGRQEQS